MNITLQTPKVYQYPNTGRPDEGLEVYLWPDGRIDCYEQGRECLYLVNEGVIHLMPALPDNIVLFNLSTFTFRDLTKTLEEVNNAQAN